MGYILTADVDSEALKVIDKAVDDYIKVCGKVEESVGTVTTLLVTPGLEEFLNRANVYGEDTVWHVLNYLFEQEFIKVKDRGITDATRLIILYGLLMYQMGRVGEELIKYKTSTLKQVNFIDCPEGIIVEFSGDVNE